MIIIRTAEDMARVLASSLDPPLRSIFDGHRARLAEYDNYRLEELAAFCILEAGDQPSALQEATGIVSLAEPPAWEYLDHHDGWYECCWVVSDDGFGWIVLIPDQPDTDAALLAHCRRHSA